MIQFSRLEYSLFSLPYVPERDFTSVKRTKEQPLKYLVENKRVNCLINASDCTEREIQKRSWEFLGN